MLKATIGGILDMETKSEHTCSSSDVNEREHACDVIFMTCEMFGEMRHSTPYERECYEQMLMRMSKPANGFSIWGNKQ